jgi:hypothetical protein
MGSRHDRAAWPNVREVSFFGRLELSFSCHKGSYSAVALQTNAIGQKTRAAQQDVTIEFRPPQYSSQASTQLPSHN